MDRKFKLHKKCLIIAEISANHGQNFNRAVSLIREAKKCKVDAVKFQAYTPDTLTIDAGNKYFQIRHSGWAGQTLYKLYSKAYTPWSWFAKLKHIADNEGILFFSTAFDRTSVDFLESLKVPFHKIASFELVDLPLIEYAAKTKKPLIMSTGMASLSEIKDAVGVAKKYGLGDVMLMKCVSDYPAEPETMNLKLIPYLSKLFNLPVGLSDHTLGIAVAVAAVAQGARLIEKHFTLSRTIKTPDSFFSLEPQELRQMVDNIRIAESALGNADFRLSRKEKQNKIFRRSLFAVRDIKKGDKFTCENVRSIRPAYGLAPKYLDDVLGRKAACDVKRALPIRLKYISKR